MEYSTLNDTQLWNAFLSGDNKALEYIYRKYYRLLYSYGLKITPNPEQVKDSIQDLFVKLHVNHKQLNTTLHIQSYLLLSLKRKLYDLSESTHEFEELPFDLLSDETITGEFFQKNDEDLKKKLKLKKALSTLTARQQEILFLRYANDLSLEEISKILHINYQSTKNFLYRTIIKLRSSYFDPSK